MKLLAHLLALLCLSEYVAALIPWLHSGAAIKRSYEELDHTEVAERSLVCKLNVVLLACKALGAQATTFCSSYLHISTSTIVISTSTPTYVKGRIFNPYLFLSVLFDSCPVKMSMLIVF